MRKTRPITIVLVLMVLTLITAESATAQTIANPSIPEFTLNYVDRSFDRPTTYKTDPLTGQTIVNESGYHVPNRNIDVSIKNQPFTPYLDSDGNYTRLYFGVRYKGHYENQWRDVLNPKYYGYYNVSQPDYTVVTINLEYYYSNSLNAMPQNQTESLQVDVQVETLVGIDYFIPTFTPWGPSGYYEFFGQSSGFSDIHTIDLGSNATTIIPNTSTTPEYTPRSSNAPPTTIPSSTPSVPEFSFLLILPLFIFVLSIAVIVKTKKELKNNSTLNHLSFFEALEMFDVL